MQPPRTFTVRRTHFRPPFQCQTPPSSNTLISPAKYNFSIYSPPPRRRRRDGPGRQRPRRRRRTKTSAGSRPGACGGQPGVQLRTVATSMDSAEVGDIDGRGGPRNPLPLPPRACRLAQKVNETMRRW
ncbi:chaperone DnaJ-domain superfamily protein [Striga asiatica]|uniref:Chaperone DnaJ-domain superfamily protein n=1 Tax=Striga asiatica TaxID=4170 RepID=A0A5A7PH19_STRAF|nr:chaperone DnaJ-domain superfamily protein [Striga asiatica]